MFWYTDVYCSSQPFRRSSHGFGPNEVAKEQEKPLELGYQKPCLSILGHKNWESKRSFS